jgi:hypothetical protein
MLGEEYKPYFFFVKVFFTLFGTDILSILFSNTLSLLRFQFITAVTMKNVVFWDVPPCGSCKNRLLGGTYHLHLQGEMN